MDGELRRQEILRQIQESDTPISGTKLAQMCSVSRQVIVQDMAVLRASGYDIVSTYRGYICREDRKAERIFFVSHADEEIEEELNLIVDFGGMIKDVFIRHEVYGELKAVLDIHSRREVQEFLNEIKTGRSGPLKNITSGRHYHTVLADSEEILDAIEKELKDKMFLL